MLKISLFTACILFCCCFLTLNHSCSPKVPSVSYDFDRVPDRIWVGEDFWTVPMEDWQVKNGRVECNSKVQNATVSLLPYLLNGDGKPFQFSAAIGLTGKGENEGSAGVLIGVEAPEEQDIRSAVYFGKGIRAGVNTGGFAFLMQKTATLPQNFNFQSFRIAVTGKPAADGYSLTMKVIGNDGELKAELTEKTEKNVRGIIQLVNNFRTAASKNNGPCFWFDDLKLEGDAFGFHPENRFGPVLWTMYTRNGKHLKLSAQLPPLGDKENREVELHLKEGNRYIPYAREIADPDARNAIFNINNSAVSADQEYRVIFRYTDAFGKSNSAHFDGIFRKEPSSGKLRFGALTCQFQFGFPYSPLVKNLKASQPDMLYFSGDQIYEGNGGYPIKREPEENAILNYLGKWYMFGWAFRELMRDRPTICTPDDHDVFQGNLWGGGGIKQSDIPGTDDLEGFTQSVKMVNVVNRTQCGHLPDPADPTPIDRGMSVWYTSLVYGRISFAIVSDRIFKNGPEHVATWEGRKDHLKKPLADPSSLDRPDLEFLGKRQEEFLKNWISEWNGADMKVLLSQTLFTNVATHHGQFDAYLLGDLDSGGWPKSGRDRAIGIMRKGYVFHITGDQHVTSLVQYGLDDYRDAGWCFVPPAITVGYSRWFRPDELGIPINNRPEHRLPNTGEYRDAFGNLNYIYAIGNPPDFDQKENRYQRAQDKASGYGMVIFNNTDRTITMESWHFLADVAHPGPDDQFPGWPVTISQFDNYGRKAVAWLPKLEIKGNPDPVVEITNSRTNELEYVVRIKGNEFAPKVFSRDPYRVRIGYPETNLWKKIENVSTSGERDETIITIDF